MSKYACKLCGKLFDRVGNGVYCDGPHYKECAVCGSLFEYSKPTNRKCCSKSCADILASKSKQHTTKICKECGKVFSPNQASQIYCKGPHTAECSVCGKLFSYDCSPSDRPKTCSRICQTKLQSITSIERTGYDNVSKNPAVKSKISSANKADGEGGVKRIETVRSKFGVDNVMYSDSVRSKHLESVRSDNYLKTRYDDFKLATGYDHPMQMPQVKAKQHETRINNHPQGVRWTRDMYANILKNGELADKYVEFKSDPKQFIAANFDHKPSVSELSAILGCTDTPIYDILINYDCKDEIVHSSSNMESEVVDFLESSVPSIKIVRNDRTIIKPQELDIYLPEYNLGIECNPSVTHNSSFIDPWGGEPKSRTYHLNKSLIAKSNNTFLFHIFGYEWINRSDVIKSMILNLLGKTSRKGARETYVCELSRSECIEFLNVNHRQGSLQYKVGLGLKDKATDELLSVMTFGHTRGTMGATESDSKSVWELSRFCNKLGTSVTGGASKLLKYFLSNYNCTKIISFSDVAHTRGDLYRHLGFVECNHSDPGYVWVNNYDTKYYNRTSCIKSNLNNIFPGEQIDIDNHTEREIMEAHGYGQVFDCGTIRWEYII